jgi:hypothetical protein
VLPSGESPILHTIRIVTRHPCPRSPSGLKNPLPPRRRSRDPSVGAQVFGATVGALLILVASKLVASRTYRIRNSFQRKWAELEDAIESGMRATARTGKEIGRRAGSQRPHAQRLFRKFAPLAAGLVAVAVASKVHHAGEERANSRGDLSDWRGARKLSQHASDLSEQVAAKVSEAGFLRRGAALCMAALSCAVVHCFMAHKSALGISDPYKQLRRHMTAGVQAISTRCEWHHCWLADCGSEHLVPEYTADGANDKGTIHEVDCMLRRPQSDNRMALQVSSYAFCIIHTSRAPVCRCMEGAATAIKQRPLPQECHCGSHRRPGS